MRLVLANGRKTHATAGRLEKPGIEKRKLFPCPKKVRFSFLALFSQTWLFSPKTKFLRFLSPSVSLMGLRR
jgi:hypothetical protein